jgi:hypothetical protein
MGIIERYSETKTCYWYETFVHSIVLFWLMSPFINFDRPGPWSPHKGEGRNARGRWEHPISGTLTFSLIVNMRTMIAEETYSLT